MRNKRPARRVLRRLSNERLSTVTKSKLWLCAIAWLIAGCSTSMTQPSDCPIPPSDLMTPPVALMTIGGNPDLAPAVMKHNADALLNDRARLIRWQKWYEKPLK